MQTRSGAYSKQPPKQKFRTPQDVYIEEQRKARPGDAKQDVLRDARQQWQQLSDKEQDKYRIMLEKEEAAYQDSLILYYGGNKNDVKTYNNLKNEIPEKPKLPINAVLRYIQENREEAKNKYPDLNSVQLIKQLGHDYEEIPLKEKQIYEKRFQKELQVYQYDLKMWKEKWQQKYEKLEDLVQKKFKKSSQKGEFEYQELKRVKKVKKLKEPVKEENKRQSKGKK